MSVNPGKKILGKAQQKQALACWKVRTLSSIKTAALRRGFVERLGMRNNVKTKPRQYS